MKTRHKRFALLGSGLAVTGLAAALVFNALGSNLSYFFSPSDIVADQAPQDHVFRLGGLVEKGSLKRGESLTVRFSVSDTRHHIPVRYTGILPDLFKEGQGVIAQGRMGADGVFIADEVLAKHDEKYMPPEVAESLARADTQPLMTRSAQ